MKKLIDAFCRYACHKLYAENKTLRDQVARLTLLNNELRKQVEACEDRLRISRPDTERGW